MFFWKTIVDGFSTYEFFFWSDKLPEGKRLDFFHASTARQFLTWLTRDPFNMGFFRDILTHDTVLGGFELYRLTDWEVLERVAELLAGGRIGVVERRNQSSGCWTSEVKIEEKVMSVTQPETKQPPADSWAVFRVVDDATGISAAGVKMKIKFADGYASEYPGGLTGRIDVRAIVAGACELGCDIQDSYIGDCFCYVGQGGDVIESDMEPDVQGRTEMTDEYKLQRGSRIIEVEEHKVQDGETLESVALKHGLSRRQLIYFNFGVEQPEDVNRMMYYSLGCTRKTEDGKSFVLSSSDDPGVLYIPQKWSGLNLDTGREHILRVKKIRARAPVWLHIDLDDPDVQNDEVILETIDGGWRHIIRVDELEKAEENWVQLRFPKPPTGKKLNLIHDTKEGDEGNYLFESVDLDELLPFDIEED